MCGIGKNSIRQNRVRVTLLTRYPDTEFALRLLTNAVVIPRGTKVADRTRISCLFACSD